MKKIIISLSIMAMVAGVVIGATSAYFSDTETASGNTITAGTIDIKVNGDNHWTEAMAIGDLKPGETDYMNLGIENVGMNPVNISKRLFSITGTGGDSGYCGASSESEFVAEGGTFWSDGSCKPGSRTDTNDNIQNKIYYDLSVKVYESESDYSGGAGTPVWWQTIETGDNKIKEVYSTNSTYVDLGMLPVGWYMFVEQSYHFDENAGNVFQGDVLTFNMEIKGEQLAQSATGQATVTLENKGGAPDWDILSGDNIQGTLTYKTKASAFEYSFVAKVKTTGNYTLIYVGTTGDYPCAGSKVIGTGHFTAGTEITISGTPDLGIDITNGKFWLVPTSSYVGSVMTSWPQSNILFETGLVNYDDTDV